MYIKKHVTGNVLSNDDSGQVHQPYKVKRLYRGDSPKHDKHGACDSFVRASRPTSTRGVITYAYASGSGRRKHCDEGTTTVRERERGGIVFQCVSTEIERRESRRLAVKL